MCQPVLSPHPHHHTSSPARPPVSTSQPRLRSTKPPTREEGTDPVCRLRPRNKTLDILASPTSFKMKTASILLGASAMAAAQVALPDGFPQCGVVCITNMLSAADALGCAADNVACLCANPRFVYGVRDCSNEYCSGDGNANTVQEFGKNMCAGAGVAISGIPGEVTASGTQSTTVMATASPTKSMGAGTSPSGSQAATETASETVSASGSAVTTSAVVSEIVSTITSDGSAIPTTIGTTTIVPSNSTGTTMSTSVGTMTTTGGPEPTESGSNGNGDNNDDNNNGDNNGDNNGERGDNEGNQDAPDDSAASIATAAPMAMVAAAAVAVFFL